MTHIEFTVRGKGIFPVDMLRYDRCYPIGPEDAAAIGWSYTEKSEGNGRRKVKLASERGATYDASPCVARWESFGWLVEVHRD